ncbi:urease accessory protein UreE [Aminobacter sp. Piv2-1]|uniref:urease accessory protein UreE n=1 Tax=Aminobacter sp. Piv2-1 TaxID=3031122 RepID=UPI00309B458A
MLRAAKIIRADAAKGQAPAFDVAVLVHDERHIRRRAIELSKGERVLVDLPEPVVLETGDLLVLEDGRTAGIVAAEEELYDIRARDAVHLTQLAWHIGNRHLAAAISADRILILRDHVIKAMLEGLGATVTDIAAPFEPVRGAYSGHDHDHGHHHGHDHGNGHHHHDHGDHHRHHD